MDFRLKGYSNKHTKIGIILFQLYLFFNKTMILFLLIFSFNFAFDCLFAIDSFGYFDFFSFLLDFSYASGSWKSLFFWLPSLIPSCGLSERAVKFLVPLSLSQKKAQHVFISVIPLNNLIFTSSCNSYVLVISYISLFSEHPNTSLLSDPFHSMLFHWLLLLFSKVSENYRFSSQHSFSEITIVVFTVS